MEMSARLTNADLAPSVERKWGSYSITAVCLACCSDFVCRGLVPR